MTRLPALLTGAFLIGCTAPPVPSAGTQFDGEFAGQNTLTVGGGFICGPASYPLAVTVRDGRFDYPFPVNIGRTAPVPVLVAADGSFQGQLLYGTEDYMPISKYKNAWVYVRGRIAGGVLEATISDDRCVHQLTARRV